MWCVQCAGAGGELRCWVVLAMLLALRREAGGCTAHEQVRCVPLCAGWAGTVGVPSMHGCGCCGNPAGGGGYERGGEILCSAA